METVTSFTSNDTDTAIKPRFVLLRNLPKGEINLFSDFDDEEELNARHERIAAASSLTKETIERVRDTYQWLGLIDRPTNEGGIVMPTLAVDDYYTVIPAHPWSTESDDVNQGTEIAISNPLPGIATIFIEARGKVIASKVLQQGEILYAKETSTTMNGYQPALSEAYIPRLGTMAKVRLVAEDGSEYEVAMPAREDDGLYGSSIRAVVPFEKTKNKQ